MQHLYHRLILIVGPTASGKTAALRQVSDYLGAPLINTGLELSRKLIELTERQRCLRASKILADIISEADNEIVLLDHIEILFDVSLKQDPLRLLKGLSRTNTLIAAWTGETVKDAITYAARPHREYRHYPIRDFRVANLVT